jgi:hypothetical protein
MKSVKLEEDTYEFLRSVQVSLKDMGKYDTMDAVVKELCMIYYWRHER